LTIALLAPLHLGAQQGVWRDQRGRTAAEISLLPKYCQTKLYDRPEDREHWVNLLGRENWEHVHHYCQGLIHTNNATLIAGKPEERMAALRASIGEFDYMIRNCSSSFVLMPEILTKKGENLIRLGRASEAMQPLQRAMELKPDYWPPYAAMSDYYKGAGNVQKAREWLEKALAMAPESRALRARLAELGGGKSGPPPAPKPAAQPAKPPAAEQAATPEAPAEPESEPAAK
jgi:tetratricopeptide (TPR) repeat protein